MSVIIPKQFACLHVSVCREWVSCPLMYMSLITPKTISHAVLTLPHTTHYLLPEFPIIVFSPLFLRWLKDTRTHKAYIVRRYHMCMWQTLRPPRVALHVLLNHACIGNFHSKAYKQVLTAASTLAGLSSLGSASMEITLIRMVSTVCTGSHRSSARS